MSDQDRAYCSEGKFLNVFNERQDTASFVTQLPPLAREGFAVAR